jgi:hypothetical protein
MRRFLNGNQLCVDLFSGQSSVGLAAMWERMPYIGIEINDEYIAAAKQKLLKCHCLSRAQYDSTRTDDPNLIKLSATELEALLSVSDESTTDESNIIGLRSRVLPHTYLIH